jgi:A/G-specific adenine glycosylase
MAGPPGSSRSKSLARRTRRADHEINDRLPGRLARLAFRRRLLVWFKRSGRQFAWREKSASVYRLIVTEALLQRTRAETVHAFYDRFFARFPSWASLAEVQESELQEYLKPIGLWKRRASSLRRLALEMVSRRGRFPRDREQIESLPGVGQYVANAIVLFAHDGREPLLDVNAARVLERHFGSRRLADIRYDPYLQRLAKSIVRSDQAISLNWALLDLAATVCRIKAPLCEHCPLAVTCVDYAARSVEELPPSSRKAAGIDYTQQPPSKLSGATARRGRRVVDP